MHIYCATNLADAEPCRAAWDALADGCVFRSWTWLSTWWRHYGDRSRELRVILVFTRDRESPPALVAVLPCYLESSWTRGRVLRLLGDGKVCSDHIGLLAAGEYAIKSAQALADHLLACDEWDAIDFAAVDHDDAATFGLHQALADRGCLTSQIANDRCWAIELPNSWDEFLALQSKSHRKQLRQLERRVLDAGDASWNLVESPDQFDAAWETFADLHQRRRQSLGEPGCFAAPEWAAFHHEVAKNMLAESRLRLSTLALDGVAIAAEYHLAGDRATYAYQGGVDPARLDEEPGRLSTIRCLQRAIAEGHARFDFLRGDEPYKAHWRAVPTQSFRLLAVAPRAWPKLRHRTLTGVSRARHLAKQLTESFG